MNKHPRRNFLGNATSGLGGIALASLLSGESTTASETSLPALADYKRFALKAKRVIYLFQSGGPPQHDLFDHKPLLDKMQGQEVPESVFAGQRLTGMTAGQSSFPVARSKFKFDRFGDSAMELNSELLPHLGGVADQIALVRSLHTEAINHDPAITFFQTGFQIAGRPSIGAWSSYGLGSENENLPAYVAMTSNRGGQALYDRLWGAGFLPSHHQGVRFRSGKNPVLNLNNPAGISADLRRQTLDVLGDLNRSRYGATGDPEIQTRIAQYEMAFRMQTSVPELADLSSEPESTFDLYGEDARKPGTFAYNVLMARRLSEQGVRFVQLFHRGWDTHSNLPKQLSQRCQETDQASAGLISDLKRRGLLDETLVVWGGEFGRTVYCQGDLSATNYGRDHHPRCFSMWMAGGGIKGGTSHGKTDEYGYNIVEDPVSVHDLHATILHLMGIDHQRLTYKFQGRHYRLTDVDGNVVRNILS
ncbi:DUF1501 domain-containing protein [Stieleria sp. TO1_6]|uniref:DUF1501 domain-containing protein n=1 Tax=Stieleria tagensis TaxID=2956795 RepID=UPI00209A981B|nr:DUF1501 domain-containing protein [Stieleria tagensis]MCO8124338.1 DUF1501 domain-containing protein [Stieleria tagensis]